MAASHLSVLLSLQAPAEGEAKEEVGAASSPPFPHPAVVLHRNDEPLAYPQGFGFEVFLGSFT